MRFFLTFSLGLVTAAAVTSSLPALAYSCMKEWNEQADLTLIAVTVDDVADEELFDALDERTVVVYSTPDGLRLNIYSPNLSETFEDKYSSIEEGE